ncbi:hypothetical protein C8R44DRAFT_875497 [Mycena epipterygia]|nr:hypothetical protein C8R44DRAFT_875497 [Mycena epipterygia]
MDPLPPHPCNENPHPKSKLKPETTSTIQYIKMRVLSIPGNYPYLTPDIPGLYRNEGIHEYLPIPFFEFRGLGTPPSDVGSPGDVYIDLTPSACALYSKAEEDWSRWAGPASTDTLSHPHFVDSKNARYVWFHPRNGAEWIS